MKIFTSIVRQVSDNVKEKKELVKAKLASSGKELRDHLPDQQMMYHLLPGQYAPIVRFNDFRELVEASARKFKHLPAFYLKGDEGEFSRQVSYIQFREDVYGLGTAMESMNMFDGFVGVISENRYEWCLAYLTIGAGGGVIVPLDRELGVEDLHNQIVSGGIRTIFYSKSMAAKIQEIAAMVDTPLVNLINMDAEEDSDMELSMDQLIIRGTAMFHQGDTRYESRKVDPEKLGILSFTSGTTSNAKAVMLSQKNICFDVYAVEHSLICDERDSMLVILPLHHTYSCTASFLTMFDRGTGIAFCRSLKALSTALTEFKPTIILMVPALLEALARRVEKAVSSDEEMVRRVEMGHKVCDRAQRFGIDIRKRVFKDIHDKMGGRLRLIISGAAAINPEVLKSFESYGFTIRQGYGLTETAPIVAVNESKGNKYESVGRPLQGVEVSIFDKDDNGIGEIGVRGDNVMMGYYMNQEATSKVFRDGWFMTGDLGYLDDDGYLYISGRSKNVIVTKNGKNIYPEELEIKLQRLPYVNEAMVTGEMDEKSGDLVVTAQIFPEYKQLEEDGITGEEAVYRQLWDEVKELNETLAPYKKVKALVVRAKDFERTSTNKVKRAAQANRVEH